MGRDVRGRLPALGLGLGLGLESPSGMAEDVGVGAEVHPLVAPELVVVRRWLWVGKGSG